jgi:hypothetical protein
MIVPLLMCLLAYDGGGHTHLDNGSGVERNSAFKGTWKRVSYNLDGKDLDLKYDVWWVVDDEDWYEAGRHGDYLGIVRWTYVYRNKDEFGNRIKMAEVLSSGGMHIILGARMSGYYKLEGGTLTVTRSSKTGKPVPKGLEPGPGKIVEVYRRVKKPN